MKEVILYYLIMLQAVFSFRNTDYKGNRIPESFKELQEAAHKISEIHLRNN